MKYPYKTLSGYTAQTSETSKICVALGGLLTSVGCQDKEAQGLLMSRITCTDLVFNTVIFKLKTRFDFFKVTPFDTIFEKI